MIKLNLYAVTVKKYKPHSSKKVVEDLENVLKRDFTNQNPNKNKHIIFHTDLGS